jgi:hypothetical protein
VILVDTSVWSLAFRRNKSGSAEFGDAEVLRRLIAGDESIGLPGIVLQELLSGVREELQFEKLRRAMAGFPIVLATKRAHIEAAQIANRCRRSGVVVSTVDCLIAAIAIEHKAQLFTTDKDFTRIAENCALTIFQNE